MRVLITGVAGFIGFHLVKCLLQKNYEIIGIDNINAYYDIRLKFSRLEQLGIEQNRISEEAVIESKIYPGFRFVKLNIADYEALEKIFSGFRFDMVIHLAAQAGVRYSLEKPDIYIKSNILGFYNILELSKLHNISKFVFASSSSVYGNSKNLPFSEKQCVNEPVSLYAATKIADEVIAYSYWKLYNIPVLGFRFFTVYGEWGRPDMAYFKFSEAILNGKEITLYNNGILKRDFTYISDIINGICLTLEKNFDTYEIFNIGYGESTDVITLVKILEKLLGKKAKIRNLPMQKGDVFHTHADVSKLKELAGYKPVVPLEEGLQKFVKWFLNFKSQNYG